MSKSVSTPKITPPSVTKLPRTARRPCFSRALFSPLLSRLLLLFPLRRCQTCLPLPSRLPSLLLSLAMPVLTVSPVPAETASGGVRLLGFSALWPYALSHIHFVLPVNVVADSPNTLIWTCNDNAPASSFQLLCVHPSCLSFFSLSGSVLVAFRSTALQTATPRSLPPPWLSSPTYRTPIALIPLLNSRQPSLRRRTTPSSWPTS